MRVPGCVPPTIVVVVMQGKQVFKVQIAWVDAMGSTEMVLDLFDTGIPVAIHVPSRPGDSRDGSGSLLGSHRERRHERCLQEGEKANTGGASVHGAVPQCRTAYRKNSTPNPFRRSSILHRKKLVPV